MQTMLLYVCHFLSFIVWFCNGYGVMHESKLVVEFVLDMWLFNLCLVYV